MSRSVSRHTPVLLLAAVALLAFVFAWFGLDTIVAPSNQPGSNSSQSPTPGNAEVGNGGVATSHTDRRRASQSRGTVEHGCLVVHDATTGHVVANARVTVDYAGDGTETWATDEDGVAPLLPRTGATLTIAADGYVALAATLAEATATAATTALHIGLQPAGNFELRLLGDRGDDDEPVEVVLLPRSPRVGDWSHDWRQVVALYDTMNDDDSRGLQRREDGIWVATAREPRPTTHEAVDGVVRFLGIRPDDGYRWALKSGGPAIMNPPFERAALSETADGQARVGSREPEHLSGPFAITANDTTSFDVKLLSTASIRGVFPVSGCDVPPQVKLFRIKTLQPSNGPAVCRTQDVAFVVASEQGGFLFEGLPPGTYAVRAWWQNGTVVQFCSATCELEHTDVDLGTIDIVTGERIFVRLDLQEQGTEQTLSPKEVFPHAEPMLGAVMVQAVPDSKLAHEQVFEALPIGFEQTYELRGFRPGTLALEPRVPPWLLASRTTSTVQTTKGVHGRFEADVLHELHLTVERRNEWLLEVPDAFRSKPFEVFSRRTMDGKVSRLEVRGPSSLDDLPYLRVLAPRCDQELFFRELAPPHRMAFVDVHEPPTAPSLQPVFETPQPVTIACPDIAVGEVARWTLPGWQPGLPIWSTKVTADGSVVLNGVPQARGLAGIDKAPDVPAR